MMKILKIGVVLALLALMVYLYPPLRLGAMVVVGRSPVCSFRQAVRSGEHSRMLAFTKNMILAASKKIQTDDKGFRLWTTPHGDFWIPDGSDYVLPFNLAEQELKIYGSHELDVQPDDIVLDCGANIGVYTRAALDNGAKLVVAIEPAPENVECLRRNFPKEISQGRVIVYPKGVWDKEDLLTLNIDPKNSAADSFVIQREGLQAGIKIPLTSIDKLVEELKLDRVSVIKMDIEGAEPKALVGGQSTIAKFHPRLAMSTYHAPDHPWTIPTIIHGIWPGYRIHCGPCTLQGPTIRPDVLIFQ